MILFFDTETTGLPDYRLPASSERQPHLVQLAAILTEDDGTERASLNVIVEPDGFTIPAGAAAVHGITDEIAARCGIPLAAAVYPFICMRSRASVLVAHNIKFDAAIMDTAISRIPQRNWHAGPGNDFCTMEHAAPIVNLPPTDRMLAAGFTKPKPPPSGGMRKALLRGRAYWRSRRPGGRSGLCAGLLPHARA